MYAYIFLVHHNCSYVDGCFIVKAENYPNASKIFRETTWHSVARPGQPLYGDDNELILNENSSILNHYPKKLPDDLNNGIDVVWCLNARLYLRPPATAGVISVAFHDG